MKMLFSAYRLDQYSDPDGFMAQAAAILCEYSVAVVLYVTHPITGIQRKLMWPPTLFEIGEACDAAQRLFENEKSVEAKGYVWDTNAKAYVKKEGQLAVSRSR